MYRVVYKRHTRRDRDAHGLQQNLERVFHRQLGQPSSVLMTADHREVWHPPADVCETAHGYVIQVELPGMRDSEIAVTIGDHSLHISGSRPERRDPATRSYLQMGVNYGAFELEVFLSQPFDYERVSAQYEDGFLLVELPRPENV